MPAYDSYCVLLTHLFTYATCYHYNAKGTVSVNDVRYNDGCQASGGYRGGHAPPPEANVPTLPLQKSVESKAGKRAFKNT